MGRSPLPGPRSGDEADDDGSSTEVPIVDAFFKLITAGPLFFVSAWLLMIFAGTLSASRAER